MTKAKSLYKQLKNAVERLDEVLREEKNEIARDSAIKRFEICLDLAWKSLKEFLEQNKGSICNSPKDCFRAGYKNGVIEYNNIWLEMTDWRNEAVHTYSEEFTDNLYAKLPQTLEHFTALLKATAAPSK